MYMLGDAWQEGYLDYHSGALADAVAFITTVPHQHPNAARFLEAIREKGLEDRVVNLGRLPQKDLAVYYHSCDALLMPSRLESFSGTRENRTVNSFDCLR